MPVDEVTKITLRAADADAVSGNCFEAMKLYSHSQRNIGKYISICDFIDIYPYVIDRIKMHIYGHCNHYWDVEKRDIMNFL